MMKVEIVNFEMINVVLLEYVGVSEMVLEMAVKFIVWCKEIGLLLVKSSKIFGIFYSDLKMIEFEKFCWGVCGFIEGEVFSN